MEHFYVITGNEFGANLSSKKNFAKNDVDKAMDYYYSVEDDDFYAALIQVDENGIEKTLLSRVDE
jgi:hypothetical protein